MRKLCLSVAFATAILATTDLVNAQWGPIGTSTVKAIDEGNCFDWNKDKPEDGVKCSSSVNFCVVGTRCGYYNDPATFEIGCKKPSTFEIGCKKP